MDFDLSDDHALLQRTVRDFARTRVAPAAAELDATKSFPYEIVRELAELGLMGIPFPVEYGGAGADTLAYALVVEELARVDSSVAITLCAHISLGTQPIYMFGSEAQKQEWLPPLCSGERLGAFGLTEPEAGSDAGNTRTRARLEDGEWVIDGAKQFITNAGTRISGLVSITARTGEREISNLVVANGTPGYEQDEPYRKMGWHASDTRGLRFSDCRVPEANLLGPRGAGLRQFLRVLDGGRIGVAAMGVGLAQGALDLALAYAKQRYAFGQPISKFQAIQGKLADMSCEIEAARLLVHRAACEKDLGRDFGLTAAQAKLKTGRLAVRCAEEAVQIHGGYGYIEEYPICRFYRDAKILTIGEGTDEIQQMVIARGSAPEPPRPMFDRVLIANRGEIVARIARSLRRLGCSPAGVRARGDPAGAALEACDVTVAIGSYLEIEAIVEAALRVGAQAIHPGYGFLSERADFARACEAAGLRWIGPPPDAIELMGDKSAARAAATAAGVPVVPGIDDPTPASVARFASEHGLPLLVKAAAGGGGRGMRLVRSLDELEAALEAARRESLAAFGDDALLVERFVAPARHIELQVLADAHGTVIDLGERECSLQRRHQKVIEETPSIAVGAELRAVLAAEGTALARACGYVGAGTVEFVAHAEAPERHYFLEMNTRLQVEHPVTEAVHGVDLVEWQLRIAAGERIELPTDAFAGGHAIEARIYAEDPAHGFLPAAGTLRALTLPRGPGIRVDAGIAAGEAIGTRYDPMIAKVIAHGDTREQALARLRGALRDTAVLGVRSNVGFLCDLLDDERVRAGELDTALVEDLHPETPPGAAARAALVALIARGLAGRGARGDAFARLAGWRLGGAAAPVSHTMTIDGERDVEVALGPIDGSGAAAAVVDGAAVEVALLGEDAIAGGRRLRLAFGGASETWTVADEHGRWWVGHEGRAWQVAPDARERGEEAAGGRDLRAPMPGSIVAVHAHEGAEVARGDVLLVMESMKMELQITAPRDGTVAALHVAAGDQVALDALLASITPAPHAPAEGVAA